MYLKTHFPVHWTLSLCPTESWWIASSPPVCVEPHLHFLYKHTLTDWYSMWERARVGLAWSCSRWGTYNLCQSKQQTRLEPGGKHGQGPLFDTDKSFHSVDNCFQVKSLGRLRVVYKHCCELYQGSCEAASMALMLQEFYWRVWLFRAHRHHFSKCKLCAKKLYVYKNDGSTSGNLTVSDISQDKPPEQLSYSSAHILQVSLWIPFDGWAELFQNFGTLPFTA